MERSPGEGRSELAPTGNRRQARGANFMRAAVTDEVVAAVAGEKPLKSESWTW